MALGGSLAKARSTNLALLNSTPAVRVSQKKEWGEIISGWETKNRYEVAGADGQTLFWAGEVGGGFGAVIARAFLKAARPFTIEIRDTAGAPVLTVKRPWRWFFARAEIFDAGGSLLGAVQKRWAFFARRYTLEGPSGEALAEVHGPFFKPWTFHVSANGVEVAKVVKKWSGLLKEAFTDADNFGLEFAPHADDKLRPICLGATFLIDFVHFENRD